MDRDFAGPNLNGVTARRETIQAIPCPLLSLQVKWQLSLIGTPPMTNLGNGIVRPLGSASKAAAIYRRIVKAVSGARARPAFAACLPVSLPADGFISDTCRLVRALLFIAGANRVGTSLVIFLLPFTPPTAQNP